MSRLTPIKSKLFEKFLLDCGCEFSRSRGDHKAYRKPGLTRPVIIPQGELPIHIIKNNLRTLGISVEEFLNWRKKPKRLL